MILSKLIPWALAITVTILTLQYIALMCGKRSIKELYRAYSGSVGTAYFIILSCFMTILYLVLFAAMYNSYDSNIKTPRILPENKYPDKRYESKLDSLKHENDSLRNELRLYIDGCDHKEQLYEQIIFDLTHQHSRKLNKQEIKDSL